MEALGVCKRYGSLVALDDVSLAFKPGEIHAVLGENGAGKSTLMGVLSGFVSPDSGEVLLDGAPIPLGRAHDCRQLGIEMIHQHFTLVPEFSVEENLALARLPSLWGPANPRVLSMAALEKGKALGWALDPKAKVRTLPVGVQQRIEILKALSAEAPVMIFDEPTAVLSPEEVEELFRVLRGLRDEGRTIILIAHKLREVMSVADHASVLRLGRLVGSAPMGELDAETLSRWIVGELPPVPVRTRSSVVGEPLRFEKITVLGDRGEVAVRDVTIELRPGEILGIGGVDGNGQLELAEYMAGVRGSPPLDARIAYIPQDRQADGLALNMSVLENMTVAGQRFPALTSGPFLLGRKLRSWAMSLIQRFDIRVRDPNERVSALSGGNQQKVVVSRALAEQPSVVVAVNPTRGLDLKATRFVREQLVRARDGGAAVALFTTDLDELFEVADRRLFMSGGRLVEADSAAAMLGSGG